MIIQDLWDAFVYTGSSQGWVSAAKLVALPIFEFHRAVVTRRPLNSTVELAPLDAGVTIRMAVPGDALLFETIVPRLRVKRFVKKLNAGEVCLIAVEGNKILGFVWVGTADSPSARETELRLGPKEVYSWGAYVAPQYRSRGIMRALLAQRNNWLREHGYETLFGVVERSNTRMLKPTHKTGEVPVGDLLSFRLLGWRISRVTPFDETRSLEAPERRHPTLES